jgi:hypothetical protein
VPLLAGRQSPVQSNPPSYISSGGYNGQGFLRFSKTSSTSGLSYMSSGSYFFSGNGMTVVTVVRFMQGMSGTFWSMKYLHVQDSVLDIKLSDVLQLCVVVHISSNGAIKSNLCTDTAVPINVWL